MATTSDTLALDAARDYTRRGYRVVPVPHRGKNPGDRRGGGYGPGWQEARLAEADLPRYFNGRPQNIGLLLARIIHASYCAKGLRVV